MIESNGHGCQGEQKVSESGLKSLPKLSRHLKSYRPLLPVKKRITKNTHGRSRQPSEAPDKLYEGGGISGTKLTAELARKAMTFIVALPPCGGK